MMFTEFYCFGNGIEEADGPNSVLVVCTSCGLAKVVCTSPSTWEAQGLVNLVLVRTQTQRPSFSSHGWPCPSVMGSIKDPSSKTTRLSCGSGLQRLGLRAQCFRNCHLPRFGTCCFSRTLNPKPKPRPTKNQARASTPQRRGTSTKNNNKATPSKLEGRRIGLNSTHKKKKKTSSRCCCRFAVKRQVQQATARKPWNGEQEVSKICMVGHCNRSRPCSSKQPSPSPQFAVAGCRSLQLIAPTCLHPRSNAETHNGQH